MSNPASLVILGASGDLTHRLLLPGLGTLLKLHSRPELTLVGAAMEEMGDEQWKQVVATALTEGGCPQARIDQVLATTRYVKLDVTNPQ